MPIIASTSRIPSEIALRHGRLTFDRPLVMGILNVTPDSFSDGGRFRDRDRAVSHARHMIDSGADIIDIGGESSRPGSDPVPLDEELERVVPVIENLRNTTDLPLSIDTTKAAVARQAIQAGADMINDISALRFDSEMLPLASEKDVPVILMHMLGVPKTMQADPHYHDCLREIKEFLAERIACCQKGGLNRTRIIIDPGIGFGKRVRDNLDIIKNIAAFGDLGCPVMIGASRKSFISLVTRNTGRADKRIGGSLAAALAAIDGGCHIIRTHDVPETIEALRIWQSIRMTN